jgi:hypothetical protein
MDLAAAMAPMKMLEARFHPPAPAAESRTYVVVGHIIIEADGDELVTRVKPVSSLGRHRAPATILATLRHLARVTAPRSWERLLSLRNRHWSFVPLDPVVVTPALEPATFADED